MAPPAVYPLCWCGVIMECLCGDGEWGRQVFTFLNTVRRAQARARNTIYAGYKKTASMKRRLSC